MVRERDEWETQREREKKEMREEIDEWETQRERETNRQIDRQREKSDE